LTPDEEAEFYDNLPISKEEVVKRIDQCFLDFSLCLPIYDEETRRNVRMIMDLDTAKLIPQWFFDLGTACKLFVPQFFPYLEYLALAIPYIQGTSDVRPPIDVDITLRDDILKDNQRRVMIAELQTRRKEKKQKAKLIKKGN